MGRPPGSKNKPKGLVIAKPAKTKPKDIKIADKPSKAVKSTVSTPSSGDFIATSEAKGPTYIAANMESLFPTKHIVKRLVASLHSVLPAQVYHKLSADARDENIDIEEYIILKTFKALGVTTHDSQEVLKQINAYIPKKQPQLYYKATKGSI